MKAARLFSIGDIRLVDESIVKPGPGEALIHVTSVGLCGSDLHWFSEAGIGDARLNRPLILGHEFAGVTESGQRVAVDPAIPCGECDPCRKGNPNLCISLRFAGHGDQDGALREWMAWPKQCLYPIPLSISAAEGSLLEPLGIALHAVDLGKIKTGMRVGVFGCGPIGLLVIQAALLAGASEVFVTEPLSHRREAAGKFGAKNWSPREEVDVSFECAGENEAVGDAIMAVKPGGRVVLAGIPNDDRTVFTASTARLKGLSLLLVRRMKFTYLRAIKLLESRQVDLRALITATFPLEKIGEAFEAAKRREGLKIIVQVSQEGLTV
jgi:L-iditol 2-dehydrogenase